MGFLKCLTALAQCGSRSGSECVHCSLHSFGGEGCKTTSPRILRVVSYLAGFRNEEGVMHSQFHNRFLRARLIFLAIISPSLALWVSSSLASTHLRQCLWSVHVTLKVFYKSRIIAPGANFSNTGLTFILSPEVCLSACCLVYSCLLSFVLGQGASPELQKYSCWLETKSPVCVYTCLSVCLPPSSVCLSLSPGQFLNNWIQTAAWISSVLG